jgi:hypothetical protein
MGVREISPNILLLLHLNGSVAERLGRALQKLLQQFESARNLGFFYKRPPPQQAVVLFFCGTDGSALYYFFRASASVIVSQCSQ